MTESSSRKGCRQHPPTRRCPLKIKEENSMICVHCGRDIPNGTKFCHFCGQPVAADQPAGQPAFNIQPGASVQPPQQPPVMGGQPAAATATVTPKAPIDPKKLAVPVAVAAVVVVGGVLIATHKPTVNLNKYINIRMSSVFNGCISHLFDRIIGYKSKENSRYLC